MLKRRILAGASLLLLVLGTMPFDAKAAGTVFKGDINSSIWTEADSPYIIDGTVEVAPSARLTIEPGTLVKFTKGSKIIVKGELKAIGVPQNKIIFTSNEENPQRSDWGGIIFANSSLDAKYSTDNSYTSGSIIKNAIIKYSVGIECNDASPYLSDNDFINNSIAVNITGTSSSPGVEILADNIGASNYDAPVTIHLENNKITDGNIGIQVMRNNGRDFISTPAGRSFAGDKYNTSFIKNNTIENNKNGIIISRGDNNLIINNTFRYNNYAINLNDGAGDFLQGNSVTKNNYGLTVKSSDVVVMLNNFNLNYVTGVDLQEVPKIIKYNNLINNKADLDNNVVGVDVSYNYWGGQSGAIVNDATTLVTSPRLESTATIESIYPIIESSPSVTNANNQTISGTKTYGSDLYVDNIIYTGFRYKTEWQYKMNLDIGNNTKIFSFVDENNHKSIDFNVSIKREKIIVVESPIVSAFAKETSKGSLVISGTKQSGASIWVGKSEVVPVDTATTWTYTLPLTKGVNNFSIFSKDVNGVTSQSVDISITRTEVDSKTILIEEKSLTKVDAAFAKKMAGKLLLQVEKDGSIWYVNIKDNKRYIIIASNVNTAVKSFATGISEKNLATILYKATKGKTNKLGESLKGKFLLRVEAGGKLVYIDVNGYRHDIGSDIVKSLASMAGGISNINLRKIEVGGL